ncbi:MAG TPA: hypothetical protein DCM32_01755, partial [Xanthomonadaceae bacterium]|nr:hypothetical protein [Xanthomonadaceae bacterium]
MLRRTALFALSSLLLTGCVTYEVVDRGAYFEAGGYSDTRYSRRVVIVDDPYDRWFYGWRGHGPVWVVDPFHHGHWFGPMHHRRGWGGPSWVGHGWHHGSGWHGGHGGVRQPPPRPVEPRPVPKPPGFGGRPDLGGPVRSGPAIGGEPLRSPPRLRDWRDPEPVDGRVEARPIARPRPVAVMPVRDEEVIFVPRKPAPEPPPRFEE